MSTLQVNDLTEPEFVLLDKLHHKDLIPFIKEALRKKNKTYYFFNFIHLIFLVIMLTLMFKEIIKGHFKFSNEFGYFSYGLLTAFTLIPIHEYIHVLAYRYIGAINTSYDMNLRKFYFMAMADQFVVKADEFKIVILAPFVTVSSICFLLVLLLHGYWIYFPLGLFFAHALFCSGDFGLLSYLETNKHKEIYTYDDKEKGESYFYERLPKHEPMRIKS